MFDRTEIRVRHGEQLRRWSRRLLWALAFLAAATLAREVGGEGYGEPLPAGAALAVRIGCWLFGLVLVLRLAIHWLIVPRFVRFLRHYIVYEAGLVYLLVAGLLAPALRPTCEVACVLLRVAVLIEVASLGAQAWIRRRPSPAILLISSFLFVIALGTIALMAPKATQGGIALTDAVFTATSATCVTGLIVLDTGRDFTPFGQAVIAILIQIGGLGLMTFVGFFSIVLGRELGVGGSVVLREALNQANLGAIGRLARLILLITLGSELLGAVGFFLLDPLAPPAFGPRLWSSAFHSVSAFCNAGFSLYADSFERARGAVGIQLLLMALIVLGGIGFTVIIDLGHFFWKVIRGATPFPRLSIHSRIVLTTSLWLLVIGTVLILAIEWSRPPFRGLDAGQKALAALFQSVTARTAGFNTVPIGALAPASVLLLMVWMFVGASPGSTGGGVKTSALAVLLLSIVSRIRGRPEVEVGGRHLAVGAVRTVATLISAAALLVATSMFILFVLEGERLGARGLAFETVSAFGTVGLSTGVTASLSTTARWVVIGTMFAGRIGPLTLIVSMAVRRVRVLYSYPPAHVIVG
ncbi:MAG: hypothetical protein JXP34_16645 [Planctomycetes bacterium]|nr:hypothetical protein [Planctomycetota bacterium]